jgi:hypothetical protein
MNAAPIDWSPVKRPEPGEKSRQYTARPTRRDRTGTKAARPDDFS